MNTNNNNNDELFQKIKQDFLDNIRDINDINKLRIHVLLDYKDFFKLDKELSNYSEIGFLDTLKKKYESQMNPVYMFNFSYSEFTKINNTQKLLLQQNISFDQLTEIIQGLNEKKLKGGSRKTKRALLKNKKHITEKKRD